MHDGEAKRTGRTCSQDQQGHAANNRPNDGPNVGTMCVLCCCSSLVGGGDAWHVGQASHVDAVHLQAARRQHHGAEQGGSSRVGCHRGQRLQEAAMSHKPCSEVGRWADIMC